MNASEKLKIMREQKGLSQADCAKALHIDRTTYAKYENGGSIRRNVEKLANFFNVSVDYLLGRTDDPKEHTNYNVITGSISLSSHAPYKSFTFSEHEISLIEKYRDLDERGQKAVEDTIERERNFSTPPLIKKEKAM